MDDHQVHLRDRRRRFLARQGAGGGFDRRLLEGHGYKVTLQKFDPYINVDPGTMSPYQHGEVYVTDDGAETDLDLGHYERFTNTRHHEELELDDRQDLSERHPEGAARRLPRPHRPGDPAHHQRNQGRDSRASPTDVDIVLVEIGGTVGDIESLPFLEAIRQFRQDVGRDNSLYVHLTLVPFIGTAGELKTKPTQHSVRDLRSIGIQPDILLCRTDRFLDPDIKRKIALFCDVDEEAVITAKDVSTIYEVPLVLAAEGLDRIVLKYLHLPQTERRMQPWEELVDRIKNPLDEITIHVVGKYVGYEDSYKSLNEALYHGGFPHRVKVNIKWIEAEALEEPNGAALLDGADGILVPGGFGNRGTRGMMKAAQIARERGIPYFGICYGFQWATVEYARNVAGLADADSTECDPDTPTKVIYKLRDLLGVDELGGTMRLGSYACELAPGSLAQRVYGATRFTSATATATSSTACTSGRSPSTACGSRADRRTASSSRSPSCPAIRGTSPCSSTRSSSRSRRGRIRCSPRSSRRAYQHKTCTAGAIAAGRAGQALVEVSAANRPALPPTRPPRPTRPDIMTPVNPVTIGRHRPSAAGARSCSSPARASSRASSTRPTSPDACATSRGAVGVPFIFKASYDKANRTSRPIVPRPGPRRGACASSRRSNRSSTSRS